MTAVGDNRELEDVEVDLLLEGIYRLYGYDFRDYARSSLKRRIWDRVRAEHVQTISGLKEKLLHDPQCMERFLLGLSVNVSAMFRDPSFYLAFRKLVVPLLRTYPFFRIWHAGCSTGEEVYSMAILLEEEGLYDRARLYATDINDSVLRRARDGIFPLAAMKRYTENYIQARGKRSFSEYYSAGVDSAIFRSSLRRNIVFAQHNLVTDGPFNDFHVVMCRNVMIYFNKSLQARVHQLIGSSLIRLGFLCLGQKESLTLAESQSDYDEVDPIEKIYRRTA